MTRRRVKYRPKYMKRGIPDTFECPECHKLTLTVRLNEEKDGAVFRCQCGFRETCKAREEYEPVDHYSQMIDRLEQARIHQ